MLLFAISLSTSGVFAQNITNYYLLPNDITLPVGEKMDLNIYWIDSIGNIHTGSNAILKEAPPVWTINGQPSTATNTSEGSIHSGLSMTGGVYTAPGKVPPINPVTAAVKIRANDSTKEEVTLVCNIKIVDPGQNWFFAYTCLKTSEETIKSTFQDFTKQIKAIGSASMLVDAPPPEKNGYVIINTEQESDHAINPRVNGFYNFHEDDIRKAPNGNTEERTLRNYAGTPAHTQGLLFEYDPSLKGFKGGIQGAGISFDVTGNDEFWKPDTYTNKLKKTIEKTSEKAYDGIGLGSNNDNVKKIKNGFSIDFSQSKDSSYTDIEGAKHTINSMEQYHAVLLWVNKESK